jgi:hypothetical protein
MAKPSLPRSQRDLVRLAVLGVGPTPDGAAEPRGQRALVRQAMHLGVGAAPGKRDAAARVPGGIFR